LDSQVEILRDKKDTELITTINEHVSDSWASKNFGQGCDFFVLVLMGHGDRREDGFDHFYGVNGLSVRLEVRI